MNQSSTEPEFTVVNHLEETNLSTVLSRDIVLRYTVQVQEKLRRLSLQYSMAESTLEEIRVLLLGLERWVEEQS